MTLGRAPPSFARRDRETKSDSRAFLERAWLRFGRPVGDRERDFRKQARMDFHGRSRELYLPFLSLDGSADVARLSVGCCK